MKQNITFFVLVLLCFGFTLVGFSKKGSTNLVYNYETFNTLSKLNGNSYDKVLVVFPNPESGILNLHCPSNFIPPIAIKAYNNKENLVKSINALIPEGSNKNKFIQFNTAGLEKGNYKIVFYDANGKTKVRMIYIEKH